MKIAIFDLQPHEKKMFDRLSPQHQLTYFKETINDIKPDKFKDSEVLSVFVSSQVDAKLLAKLPKVKLITARSTGFDNIDLKFCKKKKIAVCNVPAYGENTVAEHAFALILSLTRHLPQAYDQNKSKKFNQKPLKGIDLRQRTIGVVGAGKIGKNMIKIAHGFGMEILAYDVFKDDLLAEILDFKYTDLKTLLKKSDIITLHAPYNPKTHHLLNSKNIKQCKPGAILINTARGGLIETKALAQALDSGLLSAAGLDVLEDENLLLKGQKPTAAQKAIFDLNKKIVSRTNVVFTPHIAFNTDEAVARITETTIENIVNYQHGHVANLVQQQQLF